MMKTSRTWGYGLLALFFLAALLRVGFVLSLQDGFYFWDSVRYDRAAVHLMNEGNLGPEYNRSPVYPLFLAAVYAVFGHSILAVRLIESLLGALIAVIVALIGRQLLGARTGLLAGLIWSLYPLAVFLPSLVYPETLMTFFIACGVLALVLGKDGKKPVLLILSGALLLLAGLLKPVVLATIALLLVWLYLFSVAKWRDMIWLVGGVVLLVGLWSGTSALVFGRVIFSDPRAIKFVDRAGSTTFEDVRKGRVRRVLEDPAGFVTHYVSEFVHFWQITPDRVVMSDQNLREKFHKQDSRVVRKTVFGTNSLTTIASLLSVGPVFLLALVGLGVLVREKQWEPLALLLVLMFSFAFAYAFFFTQLRYRLPIEPYIMLLAGYALSWAVEKLRLADRWRARANPPSSEIPNSVLR